MPPFRRGISPPVSCIRSSLPTPKALRHTLRPTPLVPRLISLPLLARCGQALGVPAWVAVSFKDGAHLTSGELLADLGTAIFTPGPSGAARGGGLLAAVGLNCGPPEHAAAALQTLAAAARAAGAAPPPPLVCYPNKGEAWDVARRAWVADTALPDDDFACACRSWRDAGARFIGGCCRTTPETITGIRASLRRGRAMM